MSASPISATVEQKSEIIYLLNHPLITRAEKTKMLLLLPGIDGQRARKSIGQLKLAIAEREAE